MTADELAAWAAAHLEASPGVPLRLEPWQAELAAAALAGGHLVVGSTSRLGGYATVARVWAALLEGATVVEPSSEQAELVYQAARGIVLRRAEQIPGSDGGAQKAGAWCSPGAPQVVPTPGVEP